ncbi:MAG TPA: DUF2267 domain-containing protein [Candidatus Dormibacteraeota bacterium]|nr:DUF2267 domain-containing protein [Candidatus Dormibacteraeota bacterium]
MTDREFITAVQEAGAFRTTKEAERAADAVLAELGASLRWGEAQILAARLPRRFGRLVLEQSFTTSMGRFAPGILIARIAEREGVDRERARHDLGAVLAALDRLLPAGAREELRAELPAAFAATVGPPPGPAPAPAEPATAR